MLVGDYSPRALRAKDALCAEGVLCAFAGRIHNVDELAFALDDRASDPRLILIRSWMRWGEAMLDRLRGSFAIGVWDAPWQRGMIAVDQLGTRSLFYRHQGEKLVFASEVSELLDLLDRRPDPDALQLAHWLAFSDPPPGGTLYAGVSRLPGGHLMRLDRERVHPPMRYWPARSTKTVRRTREETIWQLRARLAQAVDRAVAEARGADGVMLSGGLDSATVAALASAGEERRRLRTYSATFPGTPSADETALIVELSERYDMDSRRLAVRGGSSVGGSIEFLERTQLPPSSPNLFFWQPLLRQAAADGVRVMLDGEGGDELFGAPRYLPADRLRHGHGLAAYRLVTQLPGAGTARQRQVLRVAAEFALRGALPSPLRQLASRSGWEQPYTPPWLRTSTAALHRASADLDRWMDGGGPRWRAWLLHAIRDSTGGPQLARDHVRQRAALAGLESAHPLLDVDLIEFMLTVDPALSFDPDLDRPLLRDAMAGTLPDSIRTRPDKSSFDAPFQQSLTRELTPIAALLLHRNCRLSEYVDLRALRQEVLERPGRKFALGGQAWALTIWRLVTAELWLNRQEDRLAPRALVERCGFPASALEVVDLRAASSSTLA